MSLGYCDGRIQRGEWFAGQRDSLDTMLVERIARDPGVRGNGVDTASFQEVKTFLVVGDHDQNQAGPALQELPGDPSGRHADSFAPKIVHAVDRHFHAGDEQAEGSSQRGRCKIP